MPSYTDSSAAKLHRKSKKYDVFASKLKELGDFPDTFITNLDRLILSMHPKYKKKSAKVANGKGKDKDGAGEQGDKVFDEERDRQARLFPGLALPDTRLKPMDKFVEEEKQNKGGAAHVPDVDDLMRELEGVAAKKTGRMTADDFIGGRVEGNGYDDGRSAKRQRTDDSSFRGRSPPPSGRDGRDNGWSSRGRPGGYGGGDRGGYAKHAGVDEKPLLYKIYDGRVTNVREFGAFVQLEGVAGRVEGTSTLDPSRSATYSVHRYGARLRHVRRKSQLCSGPRQPKSKRQSQSHVGSRIASFAIHEGCRSEDRGRPDTAPASQV